MFNVPLLPRTLEACEHDFLSADVEVRTAVARDLGRPSTDTEQQARLELLARCLSDAEAKVRCQALLSIADLQASTLRTRVLSMLSDADLKVRQMAVIALGEIAAPEDDEIVGRLASLLSAGAPPVRYQALLAYCNLRPDQCESDLKNALFDKDDEIVELGIRLVDEVLFENGHALSNELQQALKLRASDAPAPVRLLAQLVCATAGLAAPHDHLLLVVQRRLKVREPRDEQWAIELCGCLQIKEAIGALHRRAFGIFGWSLDPFRWAALSALARLGEGAALDQLLHQLHSRNYVRRVSAVQALGNCRRIEAVRALEQRFCELENVKAGAGHDEFELVSRALDTLRADLKRENCGNFSVA